MLYFNRKSFNSCHDGSGGFQLIYVTYPGFSSDLSMIYGVILHEIFLAVKPFIVLLSFHSNHLSSAENHCYQDTAKL